ncbi:MAG: ATP-binding cassette domain-containing protein [Clostridia bacterium]|nr:ATP-binding cassette domain-containing protein [Clostridia bacterium]
MNLHKRLPSDMLGLLPISDKGLIDYCIPFDLGQKGDYQLGYIVVAQGNLFVLQDGKAKKIPLSSLASIKYEAMVGCGAITALDDSGAPYIIARASLRHSERFSEFVTALKRDAAGWQEQIAGRGKEKYCDDCGTLLIGGACPKCRKTSVRFNRFYDLCKPYILRLLLISLMMVGVTFCALYHQNIQKILIDDYLRSGKGTVADVLPFFAIMIIITALQIGCTIGKNVLSVRLGSLMSMDLRSKLFKKIQSLSMSYIGSRPTGELMHRITFDTNAVRDFMERCFGNMFSNLITMVGAVFCMFAINWKLAVLVIIFTPAIIIMSRMFHKRIHRMFWAQGRKGDSMKSRLQDVISGIRVVKSFGCEGREAEKFNEQSNELARINSRNECFWAIFFPIITLVMGLGVHFATYFGGIEVLKDNMTVGTLQQFIAYAAMFYGPMRWMAHLPRMIMRMLNSLDRMYEILDEEPDIKDAPNPKECKGNGEVEFKNVTFGYDPGEPVLENINFTVKSGEMVGLVGASGVGKSTLINLLMRLYDVDSGSITIDGVDLREISNADLHRQIGVVLQDTVMFSGTIGANIRYARPDATRQQVIAAAKMANAHDFICRLPDGYDTYITERGGNVSGGERQRIAIARAILANPKLLILDEATSALDTESEELVQQAIERLTGGRTTFAIAHRLSTLRHADRIIVLNDHKVAEVGTHDQLLEKKGIYYSLINAQSKLHRIKGDNED